MNYALIAKVILVSVAIGVGLSSTYIFHMPKDNAVEQAAESFIKDQTGVKVDFSEE